MKTRIAILYQVVFHYRKPFYEYMDQNPNYDTMLFYGMGDENYKHKNCEGPYNFKNKQLRSFNVPFKTNNSIGSLPITPSLFFQLVKFNPDVILSEGQSSIVNAFTAFIYAKLYHKKFIWWSLGRLKNRKFNFVRSQIQNLVEFIEKRSDAIITYSTVGKEYFRQLGIKEEKIFVGVNVVDTDKKQLEIKKLKSLGSNERNKACFNVLFVGAIIKEKKLEILLDAFQKLEIKYPNDVSLTIVGSGNYLEEIKSYAKRKSIKNVCFTGKVVEGVSKYFLNADVFVLPSLGGLAISDAMIHGVPVIGSVADGTEVDLITPDCGILDENLDEAKLFKYLEELHLDREKLSSLKKNSFLKVSKGYNYKNYLKAFDRAISFVLK